MLQQKTSNSYHINCSQDLVGGNANVCPGLGKAPLSSQQHKPSLTPCKLLRYLLKSVTKWMHYQEGFGASQSMQMRIS